MLDGEQIAAAPHSLGDMLISYRNPDTAHFSSSTTDACGPSSGQALAESLSQEKMTALDFVVAVAWNAVATCDFQHVLQRISPFLSLRLTLDSTAAFEADHLDQWICWV